MRNQRKSQNQKVMGNIFGVQYSKGTFRHRKQHGISFRPRDEVMQMTRVGFQ